VLELKYQKFNGLVEVESLSKQSVASVEVATAAHMFILYSIKSERSV
jgi:hypothetical protein